MIDKESFFISLFNKNSKYIGDDGAFIDGFVYSQDGFFENVHFKRSWLSLQEIAEKSMLINISDAIVMNAKPKYALLTVAIPKYFTKQNLIELSNGFLNIAKKFNIEIIGGDTISNSKLDISITIISVSDNPIYRKGIKKNHLIAYTENLGSVKKDLDILFRTNNRKYLKKNSKFIKPILKVDFFYDIAKYISSSMDISDGLFFELNRLSKINKIGFSLNKKIPKKIGCSGEEYEIIFTFDKKYKAIINSIAKKYRLKINIFAKAKRGKFRNLCKAHHF